MDYKSVDRKTWGRSETREWLKVELPEVEASLPDLPQDHEDDRKVSKYLTRDEEWLDVVFSL